MYPIAVQLFSLRDMIQPGYEKEDFLQILKWVAAVGYKGVQPAGLWGYTPAEVTKIVEDLGMSLAGTHSPFCRKVEDISAAVDAAGAMKCNLIAAGFGEAEFASIDAIKKTAELVNAIRPSSAIPTHYGSVTGSADDAETFRNAVDPQIPVEIKMQY